jgi:hypothetical protein
MFGYISRQTSSVGAQPSPSSTLDATGSAPQSGRGKRQALGQALVSLGERVAGEMPSGMAPQPEGDCA